MTKMLFTLLILSGFFSINAQIHIAEHRIKDNEVPQLIEAHVLENYFDFNAKYYRMVLVDQSIRYKVVLKKERGTLYLNFDENAKLTHSETIVEYKRIPKAIKVRVENDIRTRYSLFKIGKCKQRNLKNSVVYEIVVKSKHSKYRTYYNSEGRFIEAQKIPDKPIGPIFH